MATYVDATNFLPAGTVNTLMSRGAWGVDTVGWEELITRLQLSSLSVIRAMANLTQIQEDVTLLNDLLSKHIQSQLLLPLIHMDGMQENGELALTQFNELMEIIRENQLATGITTDEKNSRTVAGTIVFN